MKSFALQQKILDPAKADLPIGNDAYGWPMITRVLVAGPYGSTGPGDTPTRRAIFTCEPGAATSDYRVRGADPRPPCAARLWPAVERCGPPDVARALRARQ